MKGQVNETLGRFVEKHGNRESRKGRGWTRVKGGCKKTAETESNPTMMYQLYSRRGSNKKGGKRGEAKKR